VVLKWDFGSISLRFYRKPWLAYFFNEGIRSPITGCFKEEWEEESGLDSSDGTVARIYPLEFPSDRFSTSDDQK